MERGIIFVLCIQWMMHSIVERFLPFLLACSVFLDQLFFCPVSLLIEGIYCWNRVKSLIFGTSYWDRKA